MIDILLFALAVGIGATIVLDLFAALSLRWTGVGGSDWGMVGRWLLNLLLGQLVFVPRDDLASASEKATGWLFHYAVGIAYAAMLPMLWGRAYVTAPTLPPAVIVGLVISTLAGGAILMPGMGAGLFGTKLPNRAAKLTYMIVGHSVFAAALYIFARAFAAAA